ncbi:protein-disulfide reductase DsbD domain-containing protein [Candidatus Mesenet endosymbiont of Agriotes lineatus]|uniref:protein-disulfide reductase DsbD domain-containing protein n=1 Tax=Candidatus Mesenet endosymbiont of Agriotes lineatus TaxID=3077948 RepID=UPI0030D423B3
MKSRFLILLILLLIYPYVATSRDKVAKFELLIGKVENSKIEAALKVKIEDGWHIYYKDNGDFGIPTSFSSDDKVFIAKTHWPKPKLHIDKIEEDTFISWVYEGIVVFPMTIDLLKNSNDTEFFLTVEYSVCKEICIPKKEEIGIKIKSDYFIDIKVRNLINEWKYK